MGIFHVQKLDCFVSLFPSRWVHADYQIPRWISTHQKKELISIRHASTHDVPPPSFCDLYGVVELTWYTPWTYWHRDHFHAVDYGQFELTPCVLLLFEVHFAVELHSAVYSDALLTRGNGHPLLLLPMVDLVRLFCEQYLFFENEITLWDTPMACATSCCVCPASILLMTLQAIGSGKSRCRGFTIPKASHSLTENWTGFKNSNKTFTPTPPFHINSTDTALWCGTEVT